MRKLGLWLAAIMVGGGAAPWFDASGGATQFQTDATLEPVAGASGAPCPE